jgi:hypothetical protein
MQFLLRRDQAVCGSASREHIPRQEGSPHRHAEHHNACRLGHRNTGRSATRAGRIGGKALRRPWSTWRTRRSRLPRTTWRDDVLAAATEAANQSAKATKPDQTAAKRRKFRNRSRGKGRGRQCRILAVTGPSHRMLLAPIRIRRPAATRPGMDIFMVQLMTDASNHVMDRIFMRCHRRQTARNICTGDGVTRIVDHFSSKARPRRSQRPNMVEHYKQSRKMERLLLRVLKITRALTPYP